MATPAEDVPCRRVRQSQAREALWTALNENGYETALSIGRDYPALIPREVFPLPSSSIP